MWMQFSNSPKTEWGKLTSKPLRTLSLRLWIPTTLKLDSTSSLIKLCIIAVTFVFFLCINSNMMAGKMCASTRLFKAAAFLPLPSEQRTRNFPFPAILPQKYEFISRGKRYYLLLGSMDRRFKPKLNFFSQVTHLELLKKSNHHPCRFFHKKKLGSSWPLDQNCWLKRFWFCFDYKFLALSQWWNRSQILSVEENGVLKACLLKKFVKKKQFSHVDKGSLGWESTVSKDLKSYEKNISVEKVI